MWSGRKVMCRFAKFLIGRDGSVIERFAPTTKPEELKSAIEKALG